MLAKVALQTVFSTTLQLLGVIVMLIQLAEMSLGSGNGEQKKAMVQQLLTQLLAVSWLPPWIVPIVGNPLIQGIVVDFIVSMLNRLKELEEMPSSLQVPHV